MAEEEATSTHSSLTLDDYDALRSELADLKADNEDLSTETENWYAQYKLLWKDFAILSHENRLLVLQTLRLQLFVVLAFLLGYALHWATTLSAHYPPSRGAADAAAAWKFPPLRPGVDTGEVMSVFAPRTWNASRVDRVAGEWGGGAPLPYTIWEYGFWRLRLWRAQPVNALATLFHTPQRKGYLPYQGRHASELVPILRRENCAFLPRPFEEVTMAQLGWLLAEPAQALNYDVRFFAQHGERREGVREQDVKDYTEAYLMEPWREGSGLCDGEWGAFALEVCVFARSRWQKVLEDFGDEKGLLKWNIKSTTMMRKSTSVREFVARWKGYTGEEAVELKRYAECLEEKYVAGREWPRWEQCDEWKPEGFPAWAEDDHRVEGSK